MRIKTSDAAKGLGIHPANIVLFVSTMVGDLADCWPDIDEGLLSTLRALKYRQKQIQTSASHIQEEITNLGQKRDSTEIRILDKLERHDKWGRNSVNIRTLQNNYCRGMPNVEDAVRALVKDRLLLSLDGWDGPYSLNPSMKGEIEKVVILARSGT